MRVFLSWSGERSKSISMALRRWLPLAIQNIDPWMSDTDLLPGQRWSETLGRELSKSDVGILSLTRKNVRQPWMLFEAGALSKSLDESHVIPLLIDVRNEELPSPLVIFQSVSLDKLGIRRLLDGLRLADPNAKIDATQLDTIFEWWWPKFEKDCAGDAPEVAQSDASSRGARGKGRSGRDILEEIFEMLRTARQPTKTDVLDSLREWKRRCESESDRLGQLSTYPLGPDSAIDNLDRWASELGKAIDIVEKTQWV